MSAETISPPTTVTTFVSGLNPEAVTDRGSPGPEGTPASVKFPLLSVVVENPVPPTVAPERGAPVLALVTVPVIVPKVGSGVRVIVPAERVFPGSTLTSVVVGLNPDRLTVRVCGPGGRPVSVKFPLLSVVVEKPIPPTVAPERGTTVPALVTVTVPVPVLVVASGVRAIVPAETVSPATAVTPFVVGLNPGALMNRFSNP